MAQPKKRKLPDFKKSAQELWQGVHAQPEPVRLPLFQAGLETMFLFGSLHDDDIGYKLAPIAIREKTVAMRMTKLVDQVEKFLDSDRSNKSAKALRAELKKWGKVKLKPRTD